MTAEDECMRCGGSGVLSEAGYSSPCPTCNGTGDREPNCQSPDCENKATPESNYTYCEVHG